MPESERRKELTALAIEIEDAVVRSQSHTRPPPKKIIRTLK